MADALSYSIQFDASQADKALHALSAQLAALASVNTAGQRDVAMQFNQAAAASDRAAAAAVRSAIAQGRVATASNTAASSQRAAAGGARQFADGQRGAADSTNGLTSALRSLGAAVAGGAMFRLLQTQVEGVAGAMVRAQQTTARLRFANDGDLRQTAEDLRFIDETADRLGVRLSSASDGYTKFAAASKTAGMATEEVRQTFLGLAESSRVLGLTADETKSTFVALTQIASKQKVTMEELQSQMGERLVVAMEAAARASGRTVAQFRKDLEKGEMDVKKFFPAFAYELRRMSEKELPAATKSLDSEVNRFLNQIERMRRAAGEGEFGAAMTAGIRSMTAALKDPSINESFQAIAVGFGRVLKSASDNIPGVGRVFANTADDIGTWFAAMFVRLEAWFDKFRLKATAVLSDVQAKLGSSVATAWMFGGLDKAAASAEQATRRAAAARRELAVLDGDKGVDARVQKMWADNAQRASARSRLPAPSTAPKLTPDIGDKPDAAPIVPNAGDNKGRRGETAMANALRSFETAVAEAQLKINAAIRDRKLAQLEADLAAERTTQEAYLRDRAALETEALDEELAALQKLKVAREAALAKTEAGKDARSQAEATKTRGELAKIDADLQALAEKRVVIDIKLGTSQDQARRQAQQYLGELEAAFKEASGDRFGAVADRIGTHLKASLADPKNQGADVQGALRRNAALEQQRNSYDQATALFERQQRSLELTIQRNNDAVSRGEISQLSADRNILAARQAVRDAMQEQLDIARQLGVAIGDPEVLHAIEEMGVRFQQSTAQVDAFALSVRDGLFADLRQGFSDLIQRGEKFGDVLRRIASTTLQKYADRYFDMAMDAMFSKPGDKAKAGADIGQNAGTSFLGAVQSGWSLVQNLFSGLKFDGLLSSLGSMLSSLMSSIGSMFSGGSGGGGGGWGGLVTSFLSAFSGRASGGAVFQGSPYIVGERGPEAFFPGTAGTVVPTDRLQGALAQLLGKNALRLPTMGTASLSGIAQPQASAGDTNVSVSPKIYFPAGDALDAIRQLPAFEHAVVAIAQANGRRIQGAW